MIENCTITNVHKHNACDVKLVLENQDSMIARRQTSRKLEVQVGKQVVNS